MLFGWTPFSIGVDVYYESHYVSHLLLVVMMMDSTVPVAQPFLSYLLRATKIKLQSEHQLVGLDCVSVYCLEEDNYVEKTRF